MCSVSKMDIYHPSLSPNPEKWAESLIGGYEPDNFPFQCIRRVGEGGNCSVFLLAVAGEDVEDDEEDEEVEEDEEAGAAGDWSVEFFGLNDVSDAEYEDDSMSMQSASDSSDDEEEEEDGSSKGGEPAALPVTSHSCMGAVDLVAKRFDYVDMDACHEGINHKTGARLCVENRGSKYIKWLCEQTAWVDTRMLTQSITSTTACFGQFVSESIIHLLLSGLVKGGVTPHVVMAFSAFECENMGYLVQEKITSTLSEVLEENVALDASDMAGLYLQTFATLHVLQRACGFKHHDLHTDNVFVKRIDAETEWCGQKLADAKFFTYDLGEAVGVLTVPNCGYIVKIGDFGDSIIDVGPRRVYRLDIHSPMSKAWGEWTPSLEGRRGYDGQLLLSEPPFESDSWRAKDALTGNFLRALRAAAQGPGGRLTSTRHRPIAGHVSDVTPLEVITRVFLDSPVEGITDFRGVAPEGARVVCLTDVKSLKPAHASVVVGRKKKRPRHRHTGAPLIVSAAK